MKHPSATDPNRIIGDMIPSPLCSSNIISKATIALRATFSKSKMRHNTQVTIIPNITLYISSISNKKTIKPDNEPRKLDLKRSMVNFFAWFSSGEMTNIIESNAQNKSIPVKYRINK